MTKTEFLNSIPASINHKDWGYAELEIVVDNKTDKGVCYRHPDRTASCGKYAATWEELYMKLRKHLVKEGYMTLE